MPAFHIGQNGKFADSSSCSFICDGATLPLMYLVF